MEINSGINNSGPPWQFVMRLSLYYPRSRLSASTSLGGELPILAVDSNATGDRSQEGKSGASYGK
jgi:hypothetical protein